VSVREPDGPQLVLRGHTRRVTSARFSSDGSYVVTASRDSTVRIWDARTGALLQTLRGHFGIVRDASFSPDGRWVVTAGPGTAGLWQAESGELILCLSGHTGALDERSRGPNARACFAEAAGRPRSSGARICPLDSRPRQPRPQVLMIAATGGWRTEPASVKACQVSVGRTTATRCSPRRCGQTTNGAKPTRPFRATSRAK
jgi:hypothetical protein